MARAKWARDKRSETKEQNTSDGHNARKWTETHTQMTAMQTINTIIKWVWPQWSEDAGDQISSFFPRFFKSNTIQTANVLAPTYTQHLQVKLTCMQSKCKRSHMQNNDEMCIKNLTQNSKNKRHRREWWWWRQRLQQQQQQCQQWWLWWWKIKTSSANEKNDENEPRENEQKARMHWVNESREATEEWKKKSSTREISNYHNLWQKAYAKWNRMSWDGLGCLILVKLHRCECTVCYVWCVPAYKYNRTKWTETECSKHAMHSFKCPC